MDSGAPAAPRRTAHVKSRAVSGRASSWDRTGGNRDFAVLTRRNLRDGRLAGAGQIEHISRLTTRCYSAKYLRKLVLEMFWDGEDNPSVRAPLGDFFGSGTRSAALLSLPLSQSSGPGAAPRARSRPR